MWVNMDFASDVDYMLSDFGTPVVYSGVTFLAIMDNSVAVINEFGQVAEYRKMLTTNKANMPSPKRGEVISVCGRDMKIDGIVSDDESVIKVWLR